MINSLRNISRTIQFICFGIFLITISPRTDKKYQLAIDELNAFSEFRNVDFNKFIEVDIKKYYEIELRDSIKSIFERNGFSFMEGSNLEHFRLYQLDSYIFIGTEIKDLVKNFNGEPKKFNAKVFDKEKVLEYLKENISQISIDKGRKINHITAYFKDNEQQIFIYTYKNHKQFKKTGIRVPSEIILPIEEIEITKTSYDFYKQNKFFNDDNLNFPAVKEIKEEIIDLTIDKSIPVLKKKQSENQTSLSIFGLIIGGKLTVFIPIILLVLILYLNSYLEHFLEQFSRKEFDKEGLLIFHNSKIGKLLITATYLYFPTIASFLLLLKYYAYVAWYESIIVMIVVILIYFFSKKSFNKILRVREL